MHVGMVAGEIVKARRDGAQLRYFDLHVVHDAVRIDISMNVPDLAVLLIGQNERSNSHENIWLTVSQQLCCSYRLIM